MAKRNKLFGWLTIGALVGMALIFAPGDAAAQGKGIGAQGKENRGQGKGKNGAAQGWEDQFNRATVANPEKGRVEPRWVVASGSAPGNDGSKNVGAYRPEHVGIYQDPVGNGYLTLLLTQTQDPPGQDPVISEGALIYTKDQYGYGIYEWNMRMSSTATSPTSGGDPKSGSVSAGFVYVNNSETEIDFEFTGNLPNILYMVNWNNADPSTNPVSAEQKSTTRTIPGLSTEFKTYKFIWEQGRITFCVGNRDGTSEPPVVHEINVPSAPAHFMINHWGTNSAEGGFAGPATLVTPRYFYVDWVRYTPLPGSLPTSRCDLP